MEYEKWAKLSGDMAEEAFCIDAGEMMMPYREAKAEIQARRKQSGDNIDGLSERVQQFRRLDRHMKNALIALEKLGYKVVKDESQAPD